MLAEIVVVEDRHSGRWADQIEHATDLASAAEEHQHRSFATEGGKAGAIDEGQRPQVEQDPM
jgi:hypothetical protein